MKFKVGDKVRVVRNDVSRNTRDAIIGAVGVIKHIDTCDTKLPYAVEFREENTEYNSCFGHCREKRGYWCCEGMLELVERKPNECIVIYRKDSDVIALDKCTGKKAVAKCSPDDEFDFNIGAKLAFERLEALEKQDKEIKVGDLVKVVDRGKLYTKKKKKVKELSEENADVMAKFRYGNELHDGEGEYLLKHKMKVYAKEIGYCLLRDINGGYILIGELGIEKCE